MVKHISVVSVELIDLEDDIDVYDIEVDIDHSFIVAGVIAHNCPTCGALDGKRWTTDGKPISNSMPYRSPPNHWRCRCSMIPVLKTWRELGINMDELSDSTRASMEGQVTDKTFSDWLKRKTETDPTFADRTLGKGRAELWRNGKITMDQMISGGKPLSLNELKAKYEKPILRQMKNDAYEIAKSGGRNKGFFNQWDKQKKGKIEKSIKSLSTQVDIHNEKIDNPKNHINKPISDHELNYLVTIYWPKEIRNFKQQIDILEGILGERHHVKK